MRPEAAGQGAGRKRSRSGLFLFPNSQDHRVIGESDDPLFVQSCNLLLVVSEAEKNLLRVVADVWNGAHSRRHAFQIERRNDGRQQTSGRIDIASAVAGGELRVRDK